MGKIEGMGDGVEGVDALDDHEAAELEARTLALMFRDAHQAYQARVREFLAAVDQGERWRLLVSMRDAARNLSETLNGVVFLSEAGERRRAQ